jgi:hypothetical protein
LYRKEDQLFLQIVEAEDNLQDDNNHVYGKFISWLKHVKRLKYLQYFLHWGGGQALFISLFRLKPSFKTWIFDVEGTPSELCLLYIIESKDIDGVARL